MHPVLKRNFEVFSAYAWLAALTAHIPNAGEHLVRYDGWYSNVSRGKRRTAQGEDPSSIQEFRAVPASAAKRAWARLIKQVYEADPLVCPRCTGAMRILAFIEPACADTADRHPEVIDLPVPGTCLRLPVAFATQEGADTHRQAADREDPDAPRDLACPSPQSAGTLHGRVIRSPAPVRSAAASGNPACLGGHPVRTWVRAGVPPLSPHRFFPVDSRVRDAGYSLSSRGRGLST
jgi:hypothetical protein